MQSYDFPYGDLTALEHSRRHFVYPGKAPRYSSTIFIVPWSNCRSCIPWPHTGRRMTGRKANISASGSSTCSSSCPGWRGRRGRSSSWSTCSARTRRSSSTPTAARWRQCTSPTIPRGNITWSSIATSAGGWPKPWRQSSGNRRAPVIVLLSDHGYRGSFRKPLLHVVPLEEKKKIFLALHLPTFPSERLDDALPPHQVFRLVLEHYFAFDPFRERNPRQ